jgi:hypothetical protein
MGVWVSGYIRRQAYNKNRIFLIFNFLFPKIYKQRTANEETMKWISKTQ